MGKLVREGERGFNGLSSWMSLKETGKGKPLRGFADKSRLEDESGMKGCQKSNWEDPDEAAEGVGAGADSVEAQEGHVNLLKLTGVFFCVNQKISNIY